MNPFKDSFKDKNIIERNFANKFSFIFIVII